MSDMKDVITQLMRLANEGRHKLLISGDKMKGVKTFTEILELVKPIVGVKEVKEEEVTLKIISSHLMGEEGNE